MTENDTMIEIDVSNELSADLMSRREAILRMSALLGGVALIGSGALIAGCRAEKASPSAAFTPDDIAYLDEIADTILPTTSTPGAKAAKTGAFMALMVTDTYHDEDEKIFRDGMRKLDEASQKKNGASFMKSTPAQRLALLQDLDRRTATTRKSSGSTRLEKSKEQKRQGVRRKRSRRRKPRLSSPTSARRLLRPRMHPPRQSRPTLRRTTSG